MFRTSPLFRWAAILLSSAAACAPGPATDPATDGGTTDAGPADADADSDIDATVDASLDASAPPPTHGLSTCASIGRDASPFNVGVSAFEDGGVIRTTIQSPIVNGVSLYVPELSDQPLARCGYLDVTRAPFGADPTGVADATTAFTDALDYARKNFLAVFVPSGTFRVSRTISCAEGSYRRNTGTVGGDRQGACMLIGSRIGARPRLVLVDGAVGFGDPSSPKAVVYFWGYGTTGAPGTPDFGSTYNNGVENLDVVLGNNPAAVGLDLVGAQGTFIHDVSVDAHGAFAGVSGVLASGGSIVNLSVDGGDYGVYADAHAAGRPVPTLTGLTLTDQKRSAIFQGRDVAETLVLVGANIRTAAGSDPAIVSSAVGANSGLTTIIDSRIELAGAATALTTGRSLHLSNVFIKGAATLVDAGGAGKLQAQQPITEWSWVKEYTLSVRPPPKNINGTPVQIESPIYEEGVRLTDTARLLAGPAGAAPPADLQSRHVWGASLPGPESPGAVNVKTAYGAKGDGTTDDSAALQKAVDDNDVVFLPKGYYRLSKTLMLRPHTKLVGVARQLSVLVALGGSGSDFNDATLPKPVVKTADDEDGKTVLSGIGVYVPFAFQGAFAVDWRVGDGSIWRQTEARLFPINGYGKQDLLPRPVPLVQVSAHGGGRWYAFEEGTTTALSPDYRILAVRGTTRPLRFYHLDPEHADLTNAFVEIANADNVAIFGFKAEGDEATPLWIKNSHGISVFGTGGLIHPPPRDGSYPAGLGPFTPSTFRVESSDDFRLVSLIDRLTPLTNPTNTLMLTERTGPGGVTELIVPPLDKPILYSRGAIPFAEKPYPRTLP